MGCQREYKIGCDKPLIFSICTHNPSTGVLTDADTSPAYRIYSEETVTPILTGTMSKLDDDNTTGFYYGTLDTDTIDENLESGKNYTIYVQATVNSVTGAMCYGFKANAWVPGSLFTSVTAMKPKIEVAERMKPYIEVETMKPKTEVEVIE